MKKDEIENILNGINEYIESEPPEVIKFGEVYTNLDLVEEMISLLPDTFFENPNLKILDPCNGIGNFPCILVQKFMKGLENFEPNIEKRYKHIMENIIYVCEIQPIKMEQYEKLFNPNDNLILNYKIDSFLDLDINKEFNIERFDLVLGNPPYQKGTDSRSSTSIYNKFVDKAQDISNKILMITPCKWYTNPSMLKFRTNMINNYGLKILKDKGNVFKTVDIKGGVSYFLLEKNYKGKCLYNDNLVGFSNNLITNLEDSKLIDSIKNRETFSKYLKSDQYFGIRNKDDRFLDIDYIDNKDNKDDIVKCYVSKQNGTVRWIKRDELKETENWNKWKVFIPTASGSKDNIGELGRLVIGGKIEVGSRSFVHFAFDSLFECESFISYLETDIIKSLIRIKKQTQLVKKDCFSLVPIVPLDRIWTNDKVKEYFNI